MTPVGCRPFRPPSSTKPRISWRRPPGSTSSCWACMEASSRHSQELVRRGNFDTALHPHCGVQSAMRHARGHMSTARFPVKSKVACADLSGCALFLSAHLDGESFCGSDAGHLRYMQSGFRSIRAQVRKPQTLRTLDPVLSCVLDAGYLIFKWLSGFSWFRAQIRKRPSKAPAAPAAPVEGAENEWLKGTFYKGQQQARSRGKA